jgi:hypothetical protein
MNIIILNPEQFFQYKTKIGIMLYSEEESNTINLFTGNKHLVVERSDVELASNDAIQDALHSNSELRELADEENLIEIHQDSPEEYLMYLSGNDY